MIEALVRLTDAAIQVMNRRTRTRRKPPRHYEYHELGHANYVLKYTGRKNQPPIGASTAKRSFSSAHNGELRRVAP